MSLTSDDVVALRWSEFGGNRVHLMLETGCVLIVETASQPSSVPQRVCLEVTPLPGRPVGLLTTWAGMMGYWVYVSESGAYGYLGGGGE